MSSKLKDLDDLYYRIQIYIDDNKETGSNFALRRNPKTKDIEFSEWNYQLNQPSYDDLKDYSTPNINSKRRQNRISSDNCKIKLVSTVERDSINAMKGCTVYNTDTNSFQIYNGSVWL